MCRRNDFTEVAYQIVTEQRRRRWYKDDYKAVQALEIDAREHNPSLILSQFRQDVINERAAWHLSYQHSLNSIDDIKVFYAYPRPETN